MQFACIESSHEQLPVSDSEHVPRLINLIWNDHSQVKIFNYFLFFSTFFLRHLKVQAASTMNQSDIRGLVCYQQTRAYSDILRREHIAFYNREFGPPQAGLSHSFYAYYSYRACTCQYLVLIQISNIKKSGFGGWVMKK